MENIWLHGNLNDIHFAELLSHIWKTERSGHLEIIKEDEKRSADFFEGQVVVAKSSLDEKLLLEIIAEWGLAPKTSLKKFDKVIAESNLSLMQAILEEGLSEVLERHQNVGTRIRSGLRDLGFEMLLPEAEGSPVMTTVLGLPGMDIARYSGWLLDERKLKISVGLGKYAGKAFRVGHMGRAARPEAAERFLQATETYLKAQ